MGMAGGMVPYALHGVAHGTPLRHAAAAGRRLAAEQRALRSLVPVSPEHYNKAM